MKKIVYILLFTGFLCPVQAQEFNDVLRYSNVRQGGTARSMGMGGAIGAAGIDFSVSAINPASLAQLRTSTAMATLGMNFTNNNSNYINRDVRDNRFNFSINNMGVTISNVQYYLGKEKKKGLINHTFSFGFNRINDFNRNITLDANNDQSNYLDFLSEEANEFLDPARIQTGFDPFFPEELALAANAIIYDANSDAYYPNLPQTINMRQLYTYNYRGRQTDWNIGWAGNFSHILYVGASLNIPAIRYTAAEKIIERGFDEMRQVEKSYELNREFSTSGNGFNAKLGAVLRANDWLRVGVAYHTPTAYSLTDQFNYNFTSRGYTNGNFIYNQGELIQSEVAENSYTLTTPGKVVVSGAFIIKKQAIVSFDYENVNYTTAKISGDGLAFINPLISQNLGNRDNFRIGFEYNYFDYRFRGGYALYASPYNDAILNSLTEGDLSLDVYSAGFGYNVPDSEVYFDAAFVYERYDDFLTPYNLETINRAAYTSFNRVNSTRLIFTIGTRF
jgi:hypothetical protein